MWVPDPAVAGDPTRAYLSMALKVSPDPKVPIDPEATGFQVVAEYDAAAFTYRAYTGGEKFVWTPSSEASYSATLVRYPAAAGTPRFTKVTVRGQKGVALTRGEWAPVGAGAAPAGITDTESEVSWVEGGIFYRLASATMDPDQLLAIAGTMVPVKP
jgi:hypothetical protein